jgi:hypothetical protein
MASETNRLGRKNHYIPAAVGPYFPTYCCSSGEERVVRRRGAVIVQPQDNASHVGDGEAGMEL